MRCKVIEAKLELLKILIQVWSGFTLALASAFGFLIYRKTDNISLLIFTLLLLGLFICVWIIIVIYGWYLTNKLESCKEE
jgi:hypothetical protein